MANKPKRTPKINVSRNENHHSEFVSVIKHFDSNVPFSKLFNNNLCDLPEKYFDINKDNSSKDKHAVNLKKRIIKFSSVSKSNAESTRSNIQDVTTLNSDHPATFATVARSSFRKKHLPLPTKLQLQSNNKNKSRFNFLSKSSKELELNTLTTTYNFLKSPSETNTLSASSSYSVIVESQVPNKDGQHQKLKAGHYDSNPVESVSGNKLSGSPSKQTNDHKSKSLVEVIENKNVFEITRKSASYAKTVSSNDDYHRESISHLNEEIKSENSKIKRRQIVELKTEIAEFRNKINNTSEQNDCMKRSNCHVQLLKNEDTCSNSDLQKKSGECVKVVLSESKLNPGIDSVAVILQDREVIPNSEEFDQHITQTDTSEVEADVSDDEASMSGFSTSDQQSGKPLEKSNTDMELNSKIEQNKLLINKVQKVLDIIKMGVQYPNGQKCKSNENTPTHKFRKDQLEGQNAVNFYDLFNDGNIDIQESKSDMNLDMGSTSCEAFQEEALKAQAAKSDVETAVRTLEETTSDETFKQLSITDDDTLDYEEISKMVENVNKNEIDEFKGIHQHRPLTRRCEKKRWLDDKFRTEPDSNNSLNRNMTAIDILQAKLNTIHDTESESPLEESFNEPPKASSANSKVSDNNNSVSSLDHTDQTTPRPPSPPPLIDQKSNSSLKNLNKPKLPEKDSGFVSENKTDIRKVFPFKSDIKDKELPFMVTNNADDKCKNNDSKGGDVRKEFTFRSNIITKIPQFVGDTKSSKTCVDSTLKSVNKERRDFSINTKLYSGNNRTCNTDPIKMYDVPKERKDAASNTECIDKIKDAASNTEAPVPRKDAISTTEGLGQYKDMESNTEYTQNNAVSNTDPPNELVDAASITDSSGDRRNENKDFCADTKPERKDFICDTKMRPDLKDATCDTESLTNNTTDIHKISTATQKGKLEGTNMTCNNVENVNIPSNNYLKKSEVLKLQILPSINIVSLPTVQRVLHFYIDQNGKSHLSYKPSIKTIGYIEMQSPSCARDDEVKVVATRTIINHPKFYEHGFREIKKPEPCHPKQNSRFFIDPTYNQDYESGSEAEKMMKQTMTVQRNLDLYEETYSSADEAGTFIEEESSHETHSSKTWTYLTKNGTYLKRNFSDPSLVIRTIKEVSARGLVSDSDTNSRLESAVEYNQPYSSGNSSQWVGEFGNKSMDEKFYKSFIDPEGFSKKQSQWKYATDKTYTNLECVSKMDKSYDDIEQKKTRKTIQTQTSPTRIPHIVMETELPVSANIANHSVDANTTANQIQSPSTKPILKSPSQKKDVSSKIDPLYKNKGTSCEKISLTITCSTEESASVKNSSSVSAPSPRLDKLQPKKNSPVRESPIKGRTTKKPSEEIRLDEGKRKKNKERPDDKRGSRSKKTEIRGRTDVTRACGDTSADKERIIPDVSIGEERRRKCDDVYNKFRNMYAMETTTDGSFSEGEIKCHCSTSSGEIHVCNRRKTYLQCDRSNSFQRNIGIAPIRKRRNYFNNWVTYYFNKNSVVNGSSSTSYS